MKKYNRIMLGKAGLYADQCNSSRRLSASNPIMIPLTSWPGSRLVTRNRKGLTITTSELMQVLVTRW